MTTTDALGCPPESEIPQGLETGVEDLSDTEALEAESAMLARRYLRAMGLDGSASERWARRRARSAEHGPLPLIQPR